MQFQNPFPTLFLLCYVAILSCVTLLSAQTIQIHDGYDSGVIEVRSPYWDEEFTFSNGLTIKTFDLVDPRTMHYSYIMGYFTIDTAYEIPYESGGEFIPWEDHLEMPDTLKPCLISEMYLDTSLLWKDNWELVPAIKRFSRSGSELPNDWPSYSEYASSVMFFVPCKDGRHFKFQVYNESYHSFTDGPYDEITTVISNYSLRWAVDSAGDGLFKQNTAVVENYTGNTDVPYTFSLSQKSLTFEMNSVQSVELSLCSLKGQVLKRMHGRGTEFPLHDLARGMYILRIKSEGQLFTEKIYKP